MKKSATTKKYKRLSILFGILSIACLIGPLLGFGIYGFIYADTKNKLVFSFVTLVCIILSLFNILFKKHLRCIPWILLLGVGAVLDKLMPVLIILAATSVLDEFLLTPLHNSFKNKYTINKEIDKRGI